MMKTTNLKFFDTYGWIAIASLVICGLTGVFLVIPYDPVKAYLSVTGFVTFNPFASFTRNMHYWSAQMFLVFTILHFIDHFRAAESIPISGGEPKRILRKGKWALLVFSLVVVLYVMLSGFILKDDADSRQAHLILTGLLTSIPYIGKLLAVSLSGSEASLITLYMHHAATATIIIFIVVYEHVHTLKVKWSTFVVTLLIVILLSLSFMAPLSQLNENIMKGPWFFVGVQEMLHLFTHPVMVVALLFFIVLLIYLTPFIPLKFIKSFKILLFITGVAYILFTLVGYFFRGEAYSYQAPWNDKYITPVTLVRNNINLNPDIQFPKVVIAGSTEGCMSCHEGMKGLSEAHNPAMIGCYSCHKGDPYTLNAEAAHRNMYKVPGNLSNARFTCKGNGCHDDITERVSGSLMANLSGMIAVDRWAFGETSAPDGFYHVSDIKNSPADIHLKNLCAGCHLGMEKTTYGNAKWLERGGGCNACHLTYDKRALYALDEISQLNQQSSSELNISAQIHRLKKLSHPSINLNITNDKCESCHSRSERISMLYAGWHETDLKSIPSNATPNTYRQLPDKRVFIKQSSDVHHDAGMLCIDCHNSYEVMGNGKQYLHKEEAVKVQCIDCHPYSNTDTVNHEEEYWTSEISETDRETQLISWLRNWTNDNPQVIRTRKERLPLVNTRISRTKKSLNSTQPHNKTIVPGEAFGSLIRKADNKILLLKRASEQCNRGKAHNRLDCESCHTAWVDQCIGCHNTYESKTMGIDMLTKKPRKGIWVEYAGINRAELPVLGIKDSNKKSDQQRVGIFAPGMIMTIDKGAKRTFHRLYAPVSGHTTLKKSRSCESCHLNPMALGYGRGKLLLTKEKGWKFKQEYKDNAYDQLPEDAWIGFLKERRDNTSTRMAVRPFNIEEQKRILLAGSCLLCHKEESKVVQLCLYDFDKALNSRIKQCFTPTSEN